MLVSLALFYLLPVGGFLGFAAVMLHNRRIGVIGANRPKA